LWEFFSSRTFFNFYLSLPLGVCLSARVRTLPGDCCAEQVFYDPPEFNSSPPARPPYPGVESRTFRTPDKFRWRSFSLLSPQMGLFFFSDDARPTLKPFFCQRKVLFLIIILTLSLHVWSPPPSLETPSPPLSTLLVAPCFRRRLFTFGGYK